MNGKSFSLYNLFVLNARIAEEIEKKDGSEFFLLLCFETLRADLGKAFHKLYIMS